MNRLIQKKQIDRFIRVPSIWIPILFTIIMIFISQFHDTFKEYDGLMQFFAGREILAGIGINSWSLHFWPPLYSLLIGIGSFVLPAFLAGKIISIICSVILLFIAYFLALELTNNIKIGLLTQLFLVLNPLYVRESFQAQNRMLDALFFVTGLFLFIKSFNKPNFGMLFLTGLICGLAGLSRYTSYTLVILPFFLFLQLDIRKAAKFSIAFLLGFSLISLPWWYYNTIINGSPFYSWQYINIGSAVVPQNGGGWKWWWWYGMSNYRNISEIILAYPKLYLLNIANNIKISLKYILLSGGVLALFVIPALFESLLLIKSKIWIIIMVLLAVYLGLVSQAIVFDYVFLSWAVIITILCIIFLSDFLIKCREKFLIFRNHNITRLVFVIAAITGLAITSYTTVSYLKDKYYSNMLVDLDAITLALQKHDANIKDKRIMAIFPARAYYAQSKYLMTPEYYEDSVDGLVSYRGISERVKMQAEKYPSNMSDSELRADYLIYTNSDYELPQFSFLLDPNSEKIPENFKLVYHSSDAVVYEIK